jgi:hypothetical protein
LACVLTDLRIEQHEWSMLAYPIEATLAGLAASREAAVVRVPAAVSLGASSRSQPIPYRGHSGDASLGASS